MFQRSRSIQAFFDNFRPRGALGSCPITGRMFVWYEDPIGPLIDYATRAFITGVRFHLENPWLPYLPLSRIAREKMKWQFGVGYVIALYSASLASCEYYTTGHPSFERYACGLMALEHFRKRASLEAPELLDRYPAEPLPGLDRHGYFKVQARPE